MAAYRVLLLPGDGIGPEVTAAARQAVDATGVDIEWTVGVAGEAAVEPYGEPLPEVTRAQVADAQVILKGPFSSHPDWWFPSPNGQLRRLAKAYVNLRFAESFPGVSAARGPCRVIVARDVTEDVYQGSQQFVGPDAAVGIKFITRAAVDRLTRFAMAYARRSGIDHVTIAHKAATLKATDGLFLQAARVAAAQFPDIITDDFLIDALAMQLVLHPERFHLIISTHQYGDILADLCAGIVGGIGLVGGASFGEGTALFEAAHGSAPRYGGQDRANPTALMISAALMLDHLGEAAAATAIRGALLEVISAGETVTPDLGGTASTSAMTSAVVGAIARY